MGDKSPEDVERELALRSHERDWALQDAMFRTVIEYGLAALKSSTLISGGSVVVGLAFAGTIYSSESGVAKQLLLAVLIFAAAAVAGGVATRFSYLAHIALARPVHSSFMGGRILMLPTLSRRRQPFVRKERFGSSSLLLWSWSLTCL